MEMGGSPLPVRVLDGVGSGQESSQTVPQEDHTGDPHGLPPRLYRGHKLVLGPLWVPRERWPRASPEAEQIEGVQSAAGAQ